MARSGMKLVNGMPRFQKGSGWTSFTMEVEGTAKKPTKAQSIIIDNAKYLITDDDNTMIVSWTYHHDSSEGSSNGLGTWLFKLPHGFMVDTDKIHVETNEFSGVCGNIAVNQDGVIGTGHISTYDTTRLQATVVSANNNSAINNNNWSWDSDNYYISLMCTIPVKKQDNEAVNRVILFERLDGSRAMVRGSKVDRGAKVLWDTKEHGSLPADFDIENLGGYENVDGKLKFSNKAFKEYEKNIRYPRCWNKLNKEVKKKIELTSWYKERHESQIDLQVETSITDEQYLELIQWWQDLRSLDKTYKTPDEVVFPNTPKWVKL